MTLSDKAAYPLDAAEAPGQGESRLDDTKGAPMDDNAAYEAAKNDPVAARILDALHDQDAATYNGNSGNIGGRALDAAASVRELVGKEERQRLAALLDEHRTTLTAFVDDPDKMLGLVILLLGLNKP